MGKLDDMRAAVARKRQAAKPEFRADSVAAKQAAFAYRIEKEEKKGAERKAPKHPHLVGMVIPRACGHSEAAGGIANLPCARCAKAIRAARLERKRKIKKARAADTDRMEARRNKKGRLPDGAVFSVTYDAGAMQWSGTLTVGDPAVTLSSSASGVFRLLSDLDNLWRERAAGSGKT